METRKKYFDYTNTNGAHVKCFEECGSGEWEKEERLMKIKEVESAQEISTESVKERKSERGGVGERVKPGERGREKGKDKEHCSAWR